jgi:predicted GNAT family N-acyltransferase
LLPSAAGWQPVGIGRLTLNLGENGEALIAWVAALPNARRQGVGGAVMRFLLGAADAAGAPLVMLAAQAHAEPFYRRLGFIAADASYIVNGVTHRWMARYPPRESTTRR